MPKQKTSSNLLYMSVLLCLVVLSIFLFIQSDIFIIDVIKIEGLNNITEDEIQKLLGTVKGENLFLVDMEVLLHKIKLHPLVREVNFKRGVPDTLVIQVKERIPAALVIIPKGVVQIDAQGTILRYFESWPQQDSPVITGVEIPETIGPGQRIESEKIELVLKLLEQAPDSLIPQIGEVHISEQEQLFLYLTSKIEVRLGFNEDFKGRLSLLNELIKDPDYQSMQDEIGYIDLTAGKPVLGK